MDQETHATYLEAADVARLLNVTPARVRQLADVGRLPCTRTAAGTRLFARDDVEALLRERTAGGNGCRN